MAPTNGYPFPFDVQKTSSSIWFFLLFWVFFGGGVGFWGFCFFSRRSAVCLQASPPSPSPPSESVIDQIPLFTTIFPLFEVLLVPRRFYALSGFADLPPRLFFRFKV